MTDYKFQIYNNNQWRTIKRPRYFNGTNWLEARAIYICGSDSQWKQVYQVVTAPVITTQPVNSNGSIQAPVITSQPTSQSGNVNTTANFNITVQDPISGTRSYQWQRDIGTGFQNVTTGSGGTTPSYTTETLTGGMSGYKYRCAVTITGGIGDAYLTVVANGNGNLTYQWYTQAGSPVQYAVLSTFGTQNTGVYYCVVTNTRNDEPISVQSDSATATWTNTSSLNSSEATLTVVGADVTTRDNNSPTFNGSNAINSNFGNTRDISFGNTTTFGNVASNFSSNWNGQVTSNFASASIQSGTLYLQIGKYADGNGESTDVDYSTDGGSTWTNIVSTGSSAIDTGATGYTVSLSSMNLSSLKVRYNGRGSTSGEYDEYYSESWIKMYDIYLIYTPS